MIAPDLLAALNAVLRELLGTPERDSAWLMAELDRLLPGDGPIITTATDGGGWTDPSRWVGRPLAIGVSLGADGWTWATSAGVSGRILPATALETERLNMLLRGDL